MADGRAPGRSLPAGAADPPLQEQHRQQGRVLRHPRELPDARGRRPFADIVRHLTPFFVTRQVVCGAGRVGIGQDGRGTGFQIVPARRLLRGRGGAGDDAEAADHQHPRRAARRRREVPPAARHHRRRQPVRDLDVPQARHDRAGAGDDRGRLPAPRPAASSDPVASCTPSRTTRRWRTWSRLRPAARSPRSSCSSSTVRAGAQVRRGPARLRRRRADRRRARALGVRAGPAAQPTR